MPLLLSETRWALRAIAKVPALPSHLRLVGLEFLLGLKPVADFITRAGASFEINLIGALPEVVF